MADNLSNRGPRDRSRISLSKDWEISYWTKTLGVTEAELREAVKRVGPSAEAVRRHLKK
jgi:hypothetical protein